jgi:hypothetical protein
MDADAAQVNRTRARHAVSLRRYRGADSVASWGAASSAPTVAARRRGAQILARACGNV